MRNSKADKMFIASIEDRINESLDNYVLTNTDFLDLHQQSLVKDICRQYVGLDYEFYGGYNDAERVICFFKPDYISETIQEYMNQNPEASEIKWIKVSLSAKSPRPPAHGDYLGSITGLGIKRETTGDILVDDDGAMIAVKSEIAQFIHSNYAQVGRHEISTSVVDICDIHIPEAKFKEFSDTVASLRLDSLIASAFKLSRGKAADAIRQGIVYVDSSEVTKPDYVVKEGARLVLRGKGKVRLSSIGGRSRKDRQYITMDKYQ